MAHRDHHTVIAALDAHRHDVEARRAAAHRHGDSFLAHLYDQAARKLADVTDLLCHAHDTTPAPTKERE